MRGPTCDHPLRFLSKSVRLSPWKNGTGVTGQGRLNTPLSRAKLPLNLATERMATKVKSLPLGLLALAGWFLSPQPMQVFAAAAGAASAQPGGASASNTNASP